MNKQRVDDYRPISDYGIIGNMLSAALVSIEGSIDWYCLPRFDSPSVFAAILDSEKGGTFQIKPVEEFESKQQYEKDTNILQTSYKTGKGSLTVTDFMPCFRNRDGKMEAFTEVHRLIECTKGEVELSVIFAPALDYARGATDVELNRNGVIARNKHHRIVLASDIPFNGGRSKATANFHLRQAEKTVFILAHGGDFPRPVVEYGSREKLEKTRQYWSSLSLGCDISGKWRQHLVRSYLTLHLLIYLPTGAVLAAPTTSLPEAIGGERNWDYRYAWLRDASLALSAFGKLGHREEIEGFMDWLLQIRRKYGDKRQTLYSIDLDAEPKEEILTHLDGYRHSRPVRIGNAAYTQNQLDVFGEVIETAYNFVSMGGHISREEWEVLSEYIDHACRHWPDLDSGIWEIRGELHHYVYSKLMCWVAIDRGRKLADMLGYEGNRDYWDRNWQLVRDNLVRKGWNPRRKAFTQHYDTDALDASNLFISLYDFLPITDERVISNIDEISSELALGNGLLKRYVSDDGLRGEEGAFLWCSFWLVRNYIRIGRLDYAETLYNRLLSYGNHLGLFPEMVDPGTGEALGNFPQALTHLAVIVTGLELTQALQDKSTAGGEHVNRL
jgi:GH15 family glucan-1,4-alpha-glucosidase